MVLGLAGAAVLLAYVTSHHRRATKSDWGATSDGPTLSTSAPPVVAVAKRRVSGALVRANPAPGTAADNPSVSPPPPLARGASGVAAADELVAHLARPEFLSGGVTSQKAEELKQSFKQLAEQGAAALPAISDYLDRFQDIDFDAVGAAKLVGYSSLRIGLLDALGQIGGPEATDLSWKTLEKTGDPQEIAFLA